MLQIFKRLWLVLTVALLTHTAFGFALLGPRDTWQVSPLGYDPQADGGDLGGPKNLGEEWRWNIPEITYAFDASFLNFFGTNGMNDIDDAVELFNREMSNFTNITTEVLLRKPTQTRRVHETARSLGIMDVKSQAMGLLAEQLGLASAERWTWTLRSRAVPGGANFTNYFVIQRNFDPFAIKPTPYVNGIRYTYQVRGYPAANFGADFEAASVFPVDLAGGVSGSVSATLGEDLTTVPNLNLHPGEYFSALTRDDIAGLRYMYSSVNVNTEDTIPNTFFRFVDTSVVNFIQGIDAFTFFTNATVTPPDLLQQQFTNLVITSTNISVTNIVSTNIVITNIVSSGLFTDTSAGVLITNLDLYVFSEASRTNSPNLLRGLYPELVITRTNAYFVPEVVGILSLTNSVWGSPSSPLILVTNFVTNIVVNYDYDYANVITNYASAVTDLDIQDVVRAPWSTPSNFQLFTNHFYIRTNKNSGGFFILDRATNANLVAYALSNEFNVPFFRSTNLIEVVDTSVFVTNVVNLFKIVNVAHIFTNVVYGAFPVLLNGSLGNQVVVTTSTNLAVRYDYTFGNLTVIPPANGSNTLTLQTITFLPPNPNPIVTTQTVPSPFPMGTILIFNPDQFIPTGQRIETFGLATNTLISFTNAATGAFVVQQLIYQTNSILFAVNPVVLQSAAGPLLRPGINSLRFRPIHYNDFLSQSNAITTNIYTAITITNGVRYTNVFRRVAGPDILFAAGDLGTSVNGVPIGITRFINFQQGGAPAPAQVDGGPGLIAPGSTISFSKVRPFLFSQNPNFIDEQNASIFFTWGSFDSRTITPRVYPEDLTTQLTLETLEAFALRRNPPR